MKMKWNLLVVFALLAALVGGTTGTAQAQETHYFTWVPAAPQEGGGTVTFTATPPEGSSNLEWSRSTEPGGTTCDLPMGSAGDVSVSTELLKSGAYQVCLKITYTDATTYDDIQSVTVTNLPPSLGTAATTPAISVAGFPVTASVPVTDYDSGLTCMVDFGDGTEPVAGILNGLCTAMHTYIAAGDYTVTFTVSEPGVDAVTATASHTVVEPYASIVIASQGTVQNPEAALHAPDGLYASIRASSEIVLALGAPVSGAALSIYHSTRSPSCAVAIASSGGATSLPLGSTVAGADRTLFTIPALASGFEYIGIQCGALSKKAVFQLDALQVEPASLPEGYAIWAIGSEGDVQNSGAAVGAPDGNYATIGETGGTMMLDLGESLHGIVTIYHSADSPACPVLWAGGMPLASTLPGATSTSVILPPAGTPSFLSIQCTGADKAVFELDAAQMRSTIEPTGYAMAVFGYDVASPAAATGEPDGQYAAMGVTSSSSAILLDMGDVVQGTFLTIYHSSTSPSCQVAITSDITQGEPQPFAMTAPGGESSIIGISQDFRYVWIYCEFSEVPWDVFELDAVHIGTTAELTGHALAASVLSGTVQNPGAAVGAPDKEYATAGSSFSAIILDLGAPMQGMLTVYHSAKSPMCVIYASLAPTDMVEPDVMLGGTDSGTESTNLFMEEQNRYVWIGCELSTGEVFELDAIYVDRAVIPTGYALTTFGSTTVEDPDAAVGAPDGQYATMTQSGSIWLDLGMVRQGTLTVYLGQAGGSCQFQGATTLSGPFVTLESLGWGPVALYGIPEGGVRYVQIDCTLLAGEVFELDAIHANPVLEPTGYGLNVYYSSPDVQNPDAATGELDHVYATVTAAGGVLILDLGGQMQGVLTVHHSSTSPACWIYATALLGAPLPFGMTMSGMEQSTFFVTTDIQYVYVLCSTLPKKTVFQLDAVHVQPGVITPTGYGMVVLMANGDVQNLPGSIGSPDDQYAMITAAQGSITLDLGALVQGPLTVYHSSASPACGVVKFTEIGSSFEYVGDTTAGAAVSTFTPSDGYRYVRVECPTLGKNLVFQLDAVEVTLPPP